MSERSLRIVVHVLGSLGDEVKAQDLTMMVSLEEWEGISRFVNLLDGIELMTVYSLHVYPVEPRPVTEREE